MDGATLVTPQLPVAQAPLAQSWMSSSTFKVVGVVALVLALIGAVYLYLTRRTLPHAERGGAAAAAPTPIAQPVVTAMPLQPTPAPAPAQPAPAPAPAPVMGMGSPATATATPMAAAAAPVGPAAAAATAAPVPSGLPQAEPAPASANGVDVGAAPVARAQAPRQKASQATRLRRHEALKALRVQIRMKTIIAKIHNLGFGDIFRMLEIKAEIKAMAAPIKLMHPNFLINQLRMICDQDGDVKAKLKELFSAAGMLNPLKKRSLLEELHPVVLGLDFQVAGKPPIKRPKLSIQEFGEYETLPKFEASVRAYLKLNPAPAAPVPAQ